MLNINKLLETTRLEVSFADTRIDGQFVKDFRTECDLTQVALANMIGVSKKTVEKWEQGKNKINNSSAVLLRLLHDNPKLIKQLYSVRHGVKGKPAGNEFTPIASVTVNPFVQKYPLMSQVPGIAV